MIKKILKKTWITILALGILVILFFFAGTMPNRRINEITWGVNFSKEHAEGFGMDWRAAYSALFSDLKIKHVKILAAWKNLVPQENTFNFDDLDFQLAEAERNGADAIVVVGMKTGRWPECHIPEWAKSMEKAAQQEQILKLLTATVERYKNSNILRAWQVENEAMFVFGDCPWYDEAFFKREIALVKQLDPVHPVMITDSGEGSLWWKAAKLGDIVGTTLYRKLWFDPLERYITYPIPAAFYGRKAWLVEKLFGKKVINGELQAEPWGQTLLYFLSREEQVKTMTPEQFWNVIDYARRTGLDTFYLWGAEWWYALKEKGEPEMWDAARKLFLN